MKKFRFLPVVISLLLASLACSAVPGLSPAEPTTQPMPTELSASPTTAPTLPATAEPTASPTLPPTATSVPTDTPVPPTATAEPTATIQVTPSAKQLEVFQEIWSTVKENYLYPNFNGLDWNAIGDEYRARVQGGLTDEAFYMAMGEMVARLNDDHSAYLSPEDAAKEDAEYAGQNQYVGIGVLSAPLEDKKKATVLLVFPGSPAEAAGIKAHDSLLAADGQALFDENGARISLLRGLPGTQVNVTVQSPGEEPRTIPITRQQISGPMPVPYTVLTTPQGKRVGYIFLISFMDRNIGPQFEAALQAMTAEGPLDGLVIDGRFNGGGSTEVAAEVFSMLTDGTLGYFVWRDTRQPLEVRGRDINGSQNVPLVVLVGDGSASYGEVFPGVLRDQGRAYIIGTTTDGNVEVLSQFSFADGSRAWIATQTFRPTNNPDVNWEVTGIVPDMEVPAEWDEVTLETDPAVLAALLFFDMPRP